MCLHYTAHQCCVWWYPLLLPALGWHQALCGGGQSVGRYQLETRDTQLIWGNYGCSGKLCEVGDGWGISCPGVAPNPVWWWKVSGKISARGWRHSSCLRELIIPAQMSSVRLWRGGGFTALRWHQSLCGGGQSVGRYQVEIWDLRYSTCLREL